MSKNNNNNLNFNSKGFFNISNKRNSVTNSKCNSTWPKYNSDSNSRYCNNRNNKLNWRRRSKDSNSSGMWPTR